MAVASHAASVQGVALRVTRLDSRGNPLLGPECVYVTRAFMRVSFTPEYEEGDEVTEKNAAGEVCVTYKSNDTLKRATMEIAICDPDPEFTELLTGGVLLKYDGSGKPPVDPGAAVQPGFMYPNATVGYAAVKSGESPNPNGVGVEVWSLAIRNGSRDADLPYFRWVFPKAQLRPSGDRVIENGLLANAFEGWSDGNINFGTGPADDWYWPDATDRPFLYARDWTQPWDAATGNGWVEYEMPLTVDTNPGVVPGGVMEVPYGGAVGDPVAIAAQDGAYYGYVAENPEGDAEEDHVHPGGVVEPPATQAVVRGVKPVVPPKAVE